MGRIIFNKPVKKDIETTDSPNGQAHLGTYALLHTL
jgi:hypothetical protein